jgi:hypothetical protein
MKPYFIFVLACLTCWILSCAVPSEEDKNVHVFTALEILPHPDTLFMSTGETLILNLRGTSINISQQTMSNSGIITNASYTAVTTDTTTQAIPPGDATWTSSNASVAIVSQGTITAGSPGMTNITATVNGFSSKPLPLNVKAVNVAPGVSLDPPPVSLIFINTITVTGTVQNQAKLSISEPSSGYNNTNVAYSSNGSFSESIAGLQPGYRTITAEARNPLDANLMSTRYKYVYYYPYGADSIVGDWIGITLGKNFNFHIAKNQYLPRYDITGTVDIKFQGIGLVQEINLVGIVNSNGTIDVSVSKSYEGFIISGSLTGYFKTTGSGEGNYSATAKKSGWPTLSGSADWTAVKKP